MALHYADVRSSARSIDGRPCAAPFAFLNVAHLRAIPFVDQNRGLTGQQWVPDEVLGFCDLTNN